jgi:protein MPE1
VNKAIEDSRKESGDASGSGQNGDGDEEQDIYSDNQPGSGDITVEIQTAIDTIPQLQADISQLKKMLQNPNLPADVRHQTEMQHEEYQVRLGELQLMVMTMTALQQQQQQQLQQVAQQAAAAQQQAVMAAGGGGAGYGGGYGGQNQSWTSQYISQQPGPDSAYQRLPVGNRRRGVKRERPSEFVEVAGDGDPAKMPRYWE